MFSCIHSNLSLHIPRAYTPPPLLPHHKKPKKKKNENEEEEEEEKKGCCDRCLFILDNLNHSFETILSQIPISSFVLYIYIKK